MWVLPHRRPAGALALGLRVEVGALDEADDEQGYSHLIEHLAFRGGQRFPAGGLQGLFDGTGTSLGHHHNAGTGLGATIYELSFPSQNVSTLPRALDALADFAWGLFLAREPLAEERAVVHEEMRDREALGARVRRAILGELFGSSRLATRHPLGTPGALAAATPERLRTFYTRFYRPDRTALVIVGDIDPDAVEAQVARTFEDWPVPAPAPARPAVAAPTGSTRALLIADIEAETPEIRIVSATHLPAPRTFDDLARRLTAEAAMHLLTRRVADRLVGGALTVSSIVDGWTLVQVAASAHPPLVAVAALAEEVAGVRAHGFTPAELEIASETTLARTRRLRADDSSVETRTLLTELVAAVGGGYPHMSRLQQAELEEAIAPVLELADLQAAIVTHLPERARLVVAVAPTTRPLAMTADLLASVHDRAAPAPPPRPRPRRRELMSRPSPPGAVVAEACIEELGVALATFGNGTRIRTRKLGTHPGRVLVCATLAGGRILEDTGTIGLTAAACLAFTRPSTDRLETGDVRDLLAGHDLSLSCGVDEDTVILQVGSATAELETALALLHVLLARPRVDPAAVAHWQECLQAYADGRAPSVSTALAATAMALLTGGDIRFRLLSAERARAITPALAQDWLDREIGRAPLEASIVGDMLPEQARELAAFYLGTLPPRPLHDARLNARTSLPTRPGPHEVATSAPSAAARAAVLEGWRAAPWADVADRRRLHLAAAVVTRRVQKEVRERAGLTYDASCIFSASPAHPAASLFSLSFYTAPERTAEAALLARRVVAEVADEGPGEEEWDAVRRQLHDDSRRALDEPRFWARTLATLDLRATDPRGLVGVPEAYARARATDTREALARYVREDRRISVVCRPITAP